MELDGSVSASLLQRWIDLVGIPGACDRCLPRRVPADYEVWITTTRHAILACMGEDYPLSWRQDLCAACTAWRRAQDVQDPEAGSQVAMVRILG